MGPGRRLRRIYRVSACPRHRGVYACGSAPQAAGKAPVGSATPCSAPPKARRRTERRSYATDTCACTSGATGAASQGKHPTRAGGSSSTPPPRRRSHGGRLLKIDARVRGLDREIGPVRHAFTAHRVDEHVSGEDPRAPRAAASQVPAAARPGTTGAHTSTSTGGTEPPGLARASYRTHSAVARVQTALQRTFVARGVVRI